MRVTPLLLAAALLLLDQATKVWVAATLPLGASVPVGLGFKITHSRNTGAAFGMLQGVTVPLGPVTLDGTLLLGILSAAVALYLLAFLISRGRRLGGLVSAALGLVLAGAVGNMLDRFRLGYVTDFIHFQVGAFDFPVFNVADSSVVVGAALLILASWAEGGKGGEQGAAEARESRRRKQPLTEMPSPPPLGGERRE